MNHSAISNLAAVARASFMEAHRTAERQTNEIFLRAMEKHYGGDPMDHVAEVTLEIQQGHSEVPMINQHSIRTVYHRIRRNVDNKILAEVKITTCHDEVRVEGEIFK